MVKKRKASKRIVKKENSLPNKVLILTQEFDVVYIPNMTEVDPQMRENYWGCVDFPERLIRIYKPEKNCKVSMIWHILMHEIVHIIVELMHLPTMNGENDDNLIDQFSLGLTSMLFENDWIRIDNPKDHT